MFAQESVNTGLYRESTEDCDCRGRCVAGQTALRGMLFTQKTKGFFVEMNEHATSVARTSAPSAPFVIEEMRECAPNDPAALEAVLSQLQPKKGPSGYIHATVGIYPPKR